MNPTTKNKLHKAMNVPWERDLPKNVVKVVEEVEAMSERIGGAEVLHPQVLALAVALVGTNTQGGILKKIFGTKPVEEDPVDYLAFKKAELIEMCKEREIDPDGKKDDLVAKLVAYDNLSSDEEE